MIAIRDNLSGGVSQCKQISDLAVIVGFSTVGTIVATWNNPSDVKYKGVKILYKTGGYPTSYNDGNVFYDSNDVVPLTTFTKSGFVDGTRYYLRAFAYTYKNATRIYNIVETGAQANGVPLQVKGQQIFTSSGIFVVPAGVTETEVFAVGGGGAGGNGGFYDAKRKGGGGGGGGYSVTKKISVTAGMHIPVTVGNGGIRFPNLTPDNISGGDGGISSFGSSLIANGGKG